MARGQLTLRDDDGPKAVDQINSALAALGLYAEEEVVLDDEEFWLWPENEEAFDLWLAVQTQWTRDVQGAAGLNYNGVEVCMKMRGIRRPRAQERLFGLIQMMEHACLDEWAQRR